MLDMGSIASPSAAISLTRGGSNSFMPQQISAVRVEDALVFKDPVDKRLEALLKTSFALLVATMQLTLVSMAICQTLAAWANHMAHSHGSILMDPLVF